MNKIIILLFIFSMTISGEVYGQFRVSRPSSTADTLRPTRDITEIKPSSSYRNQFSNPFALRQERRELRRMRNDLEFTGTLQASQTQFSNWGSGGDNTFSGRSTLFFKHVYKKNKFTFEDRVEARYGISYIEGKQFKNEDEFKINLVLSWEMATRWSYATSANLRSQFSTSYKSRDDRTRLSSFMSPGFLDLAVGFKYDRKPFSIVLSPISGNAVFMFDPELRSQGLNGVPAGKRSEWSLGPSIQANLDWQFGKDNMFRYRSYLFSFWNPEEAPTMRWENTLDIKATKFLTTTIYGFVYYDRQSAAMNPHALQYKYSFSVGLSYTFKNK